jgi:MYXO-CTERM domain-containing protein
MKLVLFATAIFMLATFTLPTMAVGQSCASAENCFCSPSTASDGIYWATVEGGDATGSQVRVTQVIESNVFGSDPNIEVVPFITESAGTDVLYSSSGYLVVNGDGSVSCPNGTFGDGLRLAQRDVETLMLADSCFAALDTVNFGGTYPPCDDAGLAGDGTLTCATGGPSGGATLGLALAGLALMRRRVR